MQMARERRSRPLASPAAAQPESVFGRRLLLLSRHCVGMGGGLFTLQLRLSGCRGFLRKPW